MPVYATRQDIETLYGAAHLETLVATTRDLDQAVARACAAASAEIDVYLGQRYALPLAVVPAIVTVWCIDIACWRLAPNIAALSEEITRRAERALALLKDVAAGKARVDELEPPPPGGAGAGGIPAAESAETAEGGAAFFANRRRYGGLGGGL